MDDLKTLRKRIESLRAAAAAVPPSVPFMVPREVEELARATNDNATRLSERVDAVEQAVLTIIARLGGDDR